MKKVMCGLVFLFFGLMLKINLIDGHPVDIAPNKTYDWPDDDNLTLFAPTGNNTKSDDRINNTDNMKTDNDNTETLIQYLADIIPSIKDIVDPENNLQYVGPEEIQTDDIKSAKGTTHKSFTNLSTIANLPPKDDEKTPPPDSKGNDNIEKVTQYKSINTSKQNSEIAFRPKANDSFVPLENLSSYPNHIKVEIEKFIRSMIDELALEEEEVANRIQNEGTMNPPLSNCSSQDGLTATSNTGENLYKPKCMYGDYSEESSVDPGYYDYIE